MSKQQRTVFLTHAGVSQTLATGVAQIVHPHLAQSDILACLLEGRVVLCLHETVCVGAARTRLASLVERGLVREIGSSPQDPKRRYYRAE